MTVEAGPVPRINPRIAAILLPLSEETYRELEASILRDGVRDPIVVWKENGDLLDGVHRLRVVTAHGLQFPSIRELSFPDEEAAKAWVLANQLARRNLTPKEASVIRGRLADSQKKDKSLNLISGKQEAPKHQNDASGNQPRKTSAVVASMNGVSQATVERDTKLSRSVDRLAAEAGPEVAQEAVRGPLRPREVIEYATSPGPKSLADLRAYSAKIEQERKPRAPTREDKRPFFTCAAIPKTLETYVDNKDGRTYADRVKLTCGHWHVFKRNKRKRPAHCGKSYPCEACGSGTRRPHEQRLSLSQLRAQVQAAVLDPVRLDDLVELVRHALQLASIPQQDALGEKLVEDIVRHAQKAGLLDRERAGSRRHAAGEEE